MGFGPARGVPLVVVMCLAEVLGMLGNATFPALIPTFLVEWDLSNTQAGWISGVYYVGYVAAVPVLVSLTDRVDAWRIYLVSTAVGGLAALGFAALADGFWSAALFRLLGGVGLAGTYMVGLRLLSDRVTGRMQSRAVSWYTANFSIGTSLSVFAAGEAAEIAGWPAAFAFAALGSLAALLLVAVFVRPGPPPERSGEGGSVFDLRPVFRNRPAMAYVLGYAAHVWELFGYRAWIVAFLALALGAQGAGMEAAPGNGQALLFGMRPTQLATLFLLLGLPASVIGNELALRYGRRRVVSVVMLSSGALSCVLGFAAGLPAWAFLPLLTVYSVLIMMDSSALTAGAVAAAEPARKGATMALPTFLGFGAGILAPLAFGAVLDAAGGERAATAWGLAFVSLALGVWLGPLAVRLLAGDRENGARRA